MICFNTLFPSCAVVELVEFPVPFEPPATLVLAFRLNPPSNVLYKTKMNPPEPPPPHPESASKELPPFPPFASIEERPPIDSACIHTAPAGAPPPPTDNPFHDPE